MGKYLCPKKGKSHEYTLLWLPENYRAIKEMLSKTSHHRPIILYKTTLNDSNLGGTRKLGEGEGRGCI